jgi:hypothetical protein
LTGTLIAVLVVNLGGEKVKGALVVGTEEPAGEAAGRENEKVCLLRFNPDVEEEAVVVVMDEDPKFVETDDVVEGMVPNRIPVDGVVTGVDPKINPVFGVVLAERFRAVKDDVVEAAAAADGVVEGGMPNLMLIIGATAFDLADGTIVPVFGDSHETHTVASTRLFT